MSYEKVPLVNGEIYHIYTRSIAGFEVFNSDGDYRRIIAAMVYYSAEKISCKFSDYMAIHNGQIGLEQNAGRIIKIIAYCVMPTHIHIVVQQLKENGISRFMSFILKSHSKYFNIKHGRKGPLWEGRFKRVLVKTDEQLLHLTRYVHLNPATGYLVNNPGDWPFSSFSEYVSKVAADKKICEFNDLLEVGQVAYRRFVEDRIAYQRELAKIKNLILE